MGPRGQRGAAQRHVPQPGILFGPVVGSVLLLGLGSTVGIFVNVAFYLPLTLFLARTRFTGHTRDDGVRRARGGHRRLGAGAARRRVGVSANGLRARSGFTVGLLGAAIGVHWSLGFSAAALCVGTAVTTVYVLRGRGAPARV